MKLALMFCTVTVGYVLLYAGFAYSVKTMIGRVIYVAAVVSGTLIGSTLGAKWFS